MIKIYVDRTSTGVMDSLLGFGWQIIFSINNGSTGLHTENARTKSGALRKARAFAAENFPGNDYVIIVNGVEENKRVHE